MRPTAITSLLKALALLPALSSADDVCLGDVCIGQELSTVHVTWDPVQLAGAGSAAPPVLPEVARAVNRIFPMATDRQRLAIAQNISPTGIGFSIDQAVLDEVAGVAPVCGLLYAFGKYRSASGHETLLVFRPDHADSPVGKWRISEIERIWYTSPEEHEMLAAKLEGVLGPLGFDFTSSRSLEYSMGLSRLSLRGDDEPARENQVYASARSAEFLASPRCGGPSIE